MGMRDMRQYLDRHQYLGEINPIDVMTHVKAALAEDYRSRTFHVLKFYELHRLKMEIKSTENIWKVMNAFVQLVGCVESQDTSWGCLEILLQDSCNIKRQYILTKEKFNAKVAQALQTPGFNAIPGLVQDVETLQTMVTEMDLDREITNAQTFEALMESVHELAVFYMVVHFAQTVVNARLVELLYQNI